MIQLMNFGADVIACSVSGNIERADVDKLLEEVDRKAAAGSNLRVYAEVGDLSLMNLIGMSSDLKALTGRKELLRQITKAAVVSDSALVRQGMQFRNNLPASIEIKLFPTAERDQARMWVEG